jgi:thiamine-monophosphate kinase
VSSSLDEARAIALLQRALGAAARGERIAVGIGDDAAVLRPGKLPLVFTVDTCVEGVHFDRSWLSLADVGWRALAAAVSDVAAMAARPVAALSSLCLPPGLGARELEQLGRGQAAAARAFGCPVAGGNLSRADVLSITTAVIGEARRPLLRSGARAGDELWLIGNVGLAAAGLELLRSRRRVPGRAAAPVRLALEQCVKAWRRPRALMAPGLTLAGRARCGADVSDGLGTDVRHLAEASGARLVIEAAALERAMPKALSRAAAALDLDPLRLMLEGGEDYALVATGPRAKRPRGARRIGRVERGRGAVLERDGRQRPLAAGFDHLAG